MLLTENEFIRYLTKSNNHFRPEMVVITNQKYFAKDVAENCLILRQEGEVNFACPAMVDCATDDLNHYDVTSEHSP